MNAQVQTQDNAPATPDYDKQAMGFANNFLAIQVRIGTWKGVKRNKRAEADAIAAAAVSSNVDTDKVARSYVDLLGANHKKLKEVEAAFTAIRTYIYANTLHSERKGAGTGQRRGDLLVNVAQFPEVKANLDKLAAKAEQALHEFLKDYDLFREQALRDMPDWVSESDFPDADEVRRKFYCHVPPPKSITPPDLRNVNIPADQAAKMLADSTAEIEGMMAAAKANLLAEATKHFDRLVKQLSEGKRLHESLITTTREQAKFFIDMGQSIGDPNLSLIGKRMRDEVANVPSTEQWKNSFTKKVEARKAAEQVQKELAQITADHEAQATAPASAEGVMVDLW